MRRIASRAAALQFIAAIVLGGLLVHTPQCAQTQCTLNSECGARARCMNNTCISDCREDRDCTMAGRPICNLNGECVAATADAGSDAPQADALIGSDVQPRDVSDVSLAMDVSMPPDAPIGPDVPPPSDVPIVTDVPMPRDVMSPGTRGYLDACTVSSECASAMCTSTAPRFCTRGCTAHADCADGQLCAAGRCELDDVGRPGCDPATASPCLQYCVGTAGGASHCTHDCGTARDCPAGYACSSFGGGRRACVDIERPCAAPTNCPTGLGFCGAGGAGCTAACTGPSDCPARLVGLPPYTCELRSGQTVCVPPADVLGPDAIGTTCSATGTNLCRSGACDDGTTPPMCNQRCNPHGQCASGFGCAPVPSGGALLLVCNVVSPSPRAWVGSSCTRGRDCVTGLCRGDVGAAYCTRLCNDGLCPSTLHCVTLPVFADDGTPIRFCDP